MEGFRDWVARRPAAVLWNVCPGAGKTIGAIRVVHGALRTGIGDCAVVVVPRNNLRKQFATAALSAGIQLDPDFSNSDPVIARDMHGIVVSYSQVASAPQLYRRLLSTVRRQPIVLLDEIHHASDDSTWGGALQEAFGDAPHVLALTGTPFRSDGTTIPFIEYDHDGLCIPGISYSWPDAIVDDVCRPLAWGVAKGSATWVSQSDGEQRTHTFDDRIGKQLRSERLRTFVGSEGFGAVIEQAAGTLRHVRDYHKNAGALIVGMDQDHANWLADLTQKTVGFRPPVITSDDDKASERIEGFRQGTAPFVVAVHMISEGVDIPRLRVGVFGSNVRTEMYLRQFAGRFVRTDRSIPGPIESYAFAPKDPDLYRIIRQMRQDVNNAAKRKKDREESQGSELVEVEKRYYAVGAHVHGAEAVHGDLPVPHGAKNGRGFAAEPEAVPARSLADQKMQLRRRINGLAQQCAEKFNVIPAKVHGTLTKRFSGAIAAADLANLQRREKQCARWLQTGLYDGFR